ARKKVLNDHNRSLSARYLRSPYGDEIKTILNSHDPEAAMREMVRFTRRAPASAAGLRRGYIESILERSQTSVTSGDGNFFISGRHMQYILEDEARLAAQVLDGDEIKALNQAADVFGKIEASRRAGTLDKIMDDRANALFRLAAGVTGARIGRGMNTGTIQTPGFVSKFAKDLVDKLSTDGAQKLLVDAIEDPDLMKALLLTEGVDPRVAKEANQRLGLWLLDTAHQYRDAAYEEDFINQHYHGR
ncbi:MAG: hypothetical protein MJA83_12180, partial [Gammaproteobacteria bacterium]|nr:hypothetical protein [Gammaproteobacteria bacterium]